MYARLSYCETEHGKLPSAIVCHNIHRYYEGDPDELIVAHKEDDGDVRASEFVYTDEQDAWKRLRAIVEQRYPDIRIDETH